MYTLRLQAGSESKQIYDGECKWKQTALIFIQGGPLNMGIKEHFN